jgi:hypothetical protein
MSRETRFDKLESDIVDALRRAQGAAPSADLDARILARAHAAVARPARRPQPIWFSMAAGLVVLVGSGLALRIAERVERAPSALDMPPPAASAPAAVADDNAAAADSAPADATLEKSSERASPKREQALPTAPAAALEQRLPTQPGAQLRRDNIATESRLDGLSDLSAAAPVADVVTPAMAPAPRPFPAEPATLNTTEEAAPMATGSVAASEMVAPAPPAAPQSVQPPAAAKVSAARAEATAELDSASLRAAAGAAAAPAAGRDLPAPGKPAVDEQRERQADAPIELQSADAFTLAVAAIRAAVARGDRSTALTLAIALQRDHPARELPDDLQALVDAPQ